MFNEFKAFALRGNVIDLAVGVIIGTAFTGNGIAINSPAIDGLSTPQAKAKIIEKLEEFFGQIIIPVERIIENRNGKRVTKERVSGLMRSAMDEGSMISAPPPSG